MLLALLLLAAPEPLRLTTPALEATGVSEEETRYWAGYFANALRKQGIAVGAVEAPDAVVTGTLARVGVSGLQLSLRAERPSGEALAAFTETAQSGSEIPYHFDRASQEFAALLFTKLQRRPVQQKPEALPEAPAAATRSRLSPGVLAGVGLAVLGAAGVGAGLGVYFMAKDKLGAVARGVPASHFAAQQQASEARTLSTISVAVLGVGGLVFVCGVLYGLYSGRVNTFITLSPYAAPGEGGLVWSGAFP